MYGKKKPPTLCESVGGGPVPEKTVDYSYLYYYITLRDNVQGQKSGKKAAFRARME